MKSLIVLAVLALTVSSTRINLVEYYRGHNKQLGLQNADRDAIKCGESFSKVVDTLKSTFIPSERNMIKLSEGLTKMLTILNYHVTPECNKYAQDLKEFFLKHANSESALRETVLRNLEEFSVEITPLFTKWLLLLIDGEDYKAGVIGAEILQILIGIKKPNLLPDPLEKVTKEVPFEADRFYNEYFLSAFKSMGITDENGIKMVSTCFRKLGEETVRVFDEFKIPFTFLPTRNSVNPTQRSTHTTTSSSSSSSSSSFTSSSSQTNPNSMDFITTLKFGEKLLREFVQVFSTNECTEAFKFKEKVFGPVMNVIQEHPILSILVVLKDIGLNYPQFFHTVRQIQALILEGKYKEAGEYRGTIEKLLVEDLMRVMKSNDPIRDILTSREAVLEEGRERLSEFSRERRSEFPGERNERRSEVSRERRSEFPNERRSEFPGERNERVPTGERRREENPPHMMDEEF